MKGRSITAIHAMGGIGMSAADLPSHVVETDPGDIIIFDEHRGLCT